MSEKPIVIRVQGEPLEKQHLTCELCGKTALWPKVDIYCGGPFGKLCEDCAKVVNKVIDRYLSMISFMPFNIVAGTIVKHSKKLSEERKTK